MGGAIKAQQGPTAGPRQCVAVGVCPPKAVQWGLGCVVQWVFHLLRPCGGACGEGVGCPPVGLVRVDLICVVKRGVWAGVGSALWSEGNPPRAALRS